MPLPQNPSPISPAEKELLNAVKTQGEHLRSQTDVLKKLATSIMDNRREFRSLRKDIGDIKGDIKKEMMSGLKGNFGEIKKYFEKANQRDNNRVQNKGAGKEDSEGGFFKSAFNKLFGPSKFQQQMMFLAELQGEDIHFIRQNFEESTKARDRELLAKAIADKINANSEEGGGGGGLLGSLGKILGAGGLLGALGTALSSLGTMLLEGIKSIFTTALAAAVAGIAKVWDMLKTLYDWFKSGGAAPGAGRPGPVVQEPSRIPLPDNFPGSGKPTGPALPELPNNQQRLPGPAGNEPPRLPNGNVSDAEIKREGPRGTQSGKMGGRGAAIGRGMLGKGGAAGAILGAGIIIGSEIYDAIKQKEEENKLKVENESDAESKRLMAANTAAGERLDSAAREKEWNDKLKALKEKMSSELDSAGEAMSKIYDEFGKPLIEKGISALNRAGELTLANGETINLLPGLGTALAESVKELTEDAKDLASSVAEGAGKLISNNVTTNNVGSSGSSPMPLAMPATSNQNPVIRDYSYSRGLR